MRIGSRKTGDVNNPPPRAGNAIASPNNFSWTVASRITATNNAIDAPDGTKTAATLIPTVTSGTHAIVLQSLTATAVPFRMRVRVKPLGYNYCALTISNNNSYTKYVQCVFNLGGQTSNINYEVGGYKITQNRIKRLPGGWFLLDMSIALADANSTHIAQIDVLDNSGASSYAGDTVSGIGVWYAELSAD